MSSETKPEGLPSGWLRTSLGEITEIVMGQSPDSQYYNVEGKGLAFFQGKAEFGEDYPETRKWCSQPNKIATKGSVLLSVRAPIGPTNYAPDDCCIGRGLAAINGLGGISNIFIRRYIDAQRPDLEAKGTGTTFTAIGGETLRSFPVALPPLPEQIRIADKLDTLLSRVSSGRERLERMQKLLKQFRQSVLSAAVSGELTREWRGGGDAEWDDLKLRDCATDFSYGSSAKSDKVGAIPVLRMGNIQGGELDWEDLVFTSDPVEIEKYRLQNGDVLFNRTNSPDLVGKTAIFRGQRDAIYAGYLIRIRTASTLLSEFLNYCLNSQYGRDYCWMVKTDGVSQSNINAQKLREFPIALPPLHEQAEIVRRVESLFALADSLEERYAQALQAFETLTPALLSKAFRGELVPQDPSDEPASVLLERIRAEQAVKAKKPKQTRKTSGETGAGGTGKRGRPRKNKAASEDGLFADVSQAKSVEEAIALLEAQKARKRLQMLQEVLEVATRQGRRLGMADLHRQYRSAFPNDDTSTFYAALKQLSPHLIAEAVQPETPWETVSAD